MIKKYRVTLEFEEVEQLLSMSAQTARCEKLTGTDQGYGKDRGR